MLPCFDPGVLSVCARFGQVPMLLCVPIALLPRNLVVFDLQNLEQRNCAHEDEWVEEPPSDGFLSRIFADGKAPGAK